ncbi:MAG: TetR/AcrR family transcriptional regulator C-terminal domain-containing protein [Eubacterium sp.]|nr:TetR/AcrR family transcriptional regulator C-terminal domain-containing protein [Eubacterium sp.]
MTKNLMKEALLDLMEHENVINISVTAICEAADVNRSTFYNHYKDPSELLLEIEQDLLDQIPTPAEILNMMKNETLLAATTAFFDYIKDNRKTVQTLFNETNGSSFTSRLVDHLMNGYVPVDENSDDLTAHFKQLYIANGTVGMLREWIRSDFPMSSEAIADMMYTISRRIAY